MGAELTTFGKNKQANAIAYDKASLHSGDPGQDGSANELSGGSPAYARKNISHALAVDGVRTAESQPIFDIPPGASVTHMALWEGANCVAKGPVSNPEDYNGQGTYKLTSADVSTLNKSELPE